MFNNIADAEYSPKVANYSIDRQRNRIRTTEATKEALRLADQGNYFLTQTIIPNDLYIFDVFAVYFFLFVCVYLSLSISHFTLLGHSYITAINIIH